MNPFTKRLSRRLEDRRLAEFIAHWDALEALVIRVYKGQGASYKDEAEYRRVRVWLQKSYPRWRVALRPHWQQTTTAQAVPEDPFTRLTRSQRARDFVGDWAAMQTLPAAREALNRLLMEMLDEPMP